MLKIKNFHFFIIFIISLLIGASINNDIILIIYQNLFFALYSAYVFVVIFQLNKIFKFLSKKDLNFFSYTLVLLCCAIIFNVYTDFKIYNLEGFEKIDYIRNNNYYQINNFIIFFIFFVNMPYLLTKSIISCEQNKVIIVSDYIKEFIFSMFIPLFIYFMVPRINKVYEDTIAENDENR